MKKIFSILSRVDKYDLEIPVLALIYFILTVIFIIYIFKWSEAIIEVLPYFK